MFGLTKAPSVVDHFNALNPLCSPGFHHCLNKFSEERSEDFFKNNIFAELLEQLRKNSYEAVGTIGIEAVYERTVLQVLSAMKLESLNYTDNKFKHVIAGAMFVPYIREIVFGVAPGISYGNPETCKFVTLGLLLKITSMLRNEPRNSFMHGVGNYASMFGVHIDLWLSNSMSKDEFMDKAQIWITGYQ